MAAVASMTLADPTIKVEKNIDFLTAGTSIVANTVMRLAGTDLLIALSYVSDQFGYTGTESMLIKLDSSLALQWATRRKVLPGAA